jgi:hypothetical protein
MASVLHMKDLIVTLTSQEVVLRLVGATSRGPWGGIAETIPDVRGVIETISLLVDLVLLDTGAER